jgi:hypothetical protein
MNERLSAYRDATLQTMFREIEFIHWWQKRVAEDWATSQNAAEYIRTSAQIAANCCKVLQML